MKFKQSHYFIVKDVNTEHQTLFVVNDGFVNYFKRLVNRNRSRFSVWNEKSTSTQTIELMASGLLSIVSIRSWADLLGQPACARYYDADGDTSL